MKQDVLDALSGKFPKRIPSKETLNHPGLINRLAGLDVYEESPQAFDRAWQRLGIVIHVPRPKVNVARPRVPGGVWKDGNLSFGDIGVYAITTTLDYCPGMDKSAWDGVFDYKAATDGFLNDSQHAKYPPAELHASFRDEGGLQGEGLLGSEAELCSSVAISGRTTARRRSCTTFIIRRFSCGRWSSSAGKPS